MSDYTSISVRHNTRPFYEEAREAVAAELGDEPTNDDVVRELAEAYLGRDACGQWRDHP